MKYVIKASLYSTTGGKTQRKIFSVSDIYDEKELSEKYLRVFGVPYTPKTSQIKISYKDMSFVDRLKAWLITNTATLWAMFAIALIGIVFFINLFTFTYIPTGSMEKTIPAKSFAVASNHAFDKDGAQRGDIALFFYPDDEKTRFVKRVIGVPGDIVSLRDDVVYVNGEAIKEDYVFGKTEKLVSVYVPQKGDEVYYDPGTDSASINDIYMGNVDFVNRYCEKTEDGRYVVKTNCYYMLGDNRGDSADARFWTYKFVTDEELIGQINHWF